MSRVGRWLYRRDLEGKWCDLWGHRWEYDFFDSTEWEKSQGLGDRGWGRRCLRCGLAGFDTGVQMRVR